MSCSPRVGDTKVGLCSWCERPYKGAEKDPEATMMVLAELIAEEQPDVDYGSME